MNSGINYKYVYCNTEGFIYSCIIYMQYRAHAHAGHTRTRQYFMGAEKSIYSISRKIEFCSVMTPCVYKWTSTARPSPPGGPRNNSLPPSGTCQHKNIKKLLVKLYRCYSNIIITSDVWWGRQCDVITIRFTHISTLQTILSNNWLGAVNGLCLRFS